MILDVPRCSLWSSATSISDGILFYEMDLQTKNSDMSFLSSQTGASKLFCIGFSLFWSRSRNWGIFLLKLFLYLIFYHNQIKICYNSTVRMAFFLPILSVTFKDKKPLVKRLRNCLLQILHQLPSFILQTAQLRFQEGKGIFQWWSWHGKSAWEIVEAIYHLWEIVARIYHPSPGWQKLRTRSPSSGGKVRISTKGRVPNIWYLVANSRFFAIYALLRILVRSPTYAILSRIGV